MTRIHIGANFEGYEAARTYADSFASDGHEVIWHAAPSYDDNDDYPAIVVRTIKSVIDDEDGGRDARALLFGGTGAGEVIAANKVNGGRVVSATETSYVVDARTHADINGLVVPTSHVSGATIGHLIAALLDTPFSNDLDDARRLVNIAEFETAGTIEGWNIEP